MGVITVVDIDYGHIFGPFPISSTAMDPTYAIGMLTQDTQHQGPMLEIDPSINNGLARGMEWLAYINPARNEDEQNMEAYVKNKEVFYRALRIIKSREELLVWYSKDFCQLIDVPEVKRIPLAENEKYICSRCGETFEYIFSLKAHMKFKCEVGSHKMRLNKQSLSVSTELESNHCRKRSLEHSEDIANKKFLKENVHGIDKIMLSKDYRDVNSNVPNHAHEKSDLCSSAFRKVEKEAISSPKDENKVDVSQKDKTNMKYENDRLCVPPYVSLPVSTKECFVPPDMLSTLMIPRGMMNASINTDIHNKVMDTYGIGMAYPFSVQNSIMGNMESLSPNSRKQYLMNMNSSLTASIPFSKSANPMVEKILQTSNMAMLHKPLPALTQSTNWCAKCNTSFRMTSDLVYHMRSHHSKESPTVIKKRDDKLKCNICQETFKERHHLTRHMTSHQ
ncbi:PR domain zinc finger protein 8-like [Mytilus californianus]|uniref:PR domain zinc finger protein 8-like n=1 Tax=Mytilus californianus TaxID=6549 RepID=UPI002246948A|nr:PR domain zinc finger protein 8-like [Mytilus californianus]